MIIFVFCGEKDATFLSLELLSIVCCKQGIPTWRYCSLTSCKGKTTVDDEGNSENPTKEEDDNSEEALADEWW